MTSWKGVQLIQRWSDICLISLLKQQLIKICSTGPSKFKSLKLLETVVSLLKQTKNQRLNNTKRQQIAIEWASCDCWKAKAELTNHISPIKTLPICMTSIGKVWHKTTLLAENYKVQNFTTMAALISGHPFQKLIAIHFHPYNPVLLKQNNCSILFCGIFLANLFVHLVALGNILRKLEIRHFYNQLW